MPERARSPRRDRSGRDDELALRHRETRQLVHPPLSFVLIATCGLIGLPIATLFTLHMALHPRPDLAIVLGVSLGIALALSMVGQTMWSRRPESELFSIGDLMAWNAIRRRSAERRVERKAHLLGFDLSGRFAGHVRVPLEQQVAIARDISHALEIKSTYSRNHSRRVERHVRRMAFAAGLSHEEIEQVAVAAALHDIGNIQVPDDLLRKPGQLTQAERDAVEGHVLLGAAMAFTAGSAEVVEGIRHHHERWDGTGYPSHLVGEEIPLFARMIAIAAAFEAMTSPRPYRRSFTREHALDVIKSQAGSQFDPNLVELFIASLPEQRAAALVPLLAMPIRAVRNTSMSLRRMGTGSMAAAIAAGSAVLLLGTAIISPGTFRLPSAPFQPQTVAPERSDVVVDLDAGEADEDRDRRDEARPDDDPAPDASDPILDLVLGTRVARGPDEIPPTDEGPSPTPTPGPGPGPGPGTPPPPGQWGGGLPGPGFGGPGSSPHPDDEPDGPSAARGKGNGKGKDKDKDKGGHAYGHDKDKGGGGGEARGHDRARGEGHDKSHGKGHPETDTTGGSATTDTGGGSGGSNGSKQPKPPKHRNSSDGSQGPPGGAPPVAPPAAQPSAPPAAAAPGQGHGGPKKDKDAAK